MKLREIKLTPPIVAISAMLLASGAAQAASYTCHNYLWSNSLEDGDFNADGNWVDKTSTSSALRESWFFPSEAGGGTVRMSDDFTNVLQSYSFTFTNDVGRGLTTLDLNGQTLDLGARWAVVSFQNASPIVMSNGTYLATTSDQRYGRYGRTDGQLVEVCFTNMVINHKAFSGGGYVPTSFGPHSFTFIDSAVTKFPAHTGTLSDSELTFDNSTYAVMQMTFSERATNATIRLVNNASWTSENTAQHWIKTNPGNVNCRVVMTSGASSNTQKYYLNGTNNVLALTNVVAKQVFVGGKNNFADLHSVSMNYASNQDGFGLEGEDGTIRLSGDLSDFSVVNLYFSTASTRSRFEFADNSTVEKQNMRVYFRAANNPTYYLGTNCFVSIAGLLMNYKGSDDGWKWNGTDSTNALVYVGRGSVLQPTQISYGGKGTGALNGYNAKMVLDNGKFRYAGFKEGLAVYCGVTIELLGDDAEFYVGYEATGSCPLYLGLDAGPHDLGTVLKFRPGPLAYHGVPPVGMKTLGSSTMSDKVSIKVDLSDYIPSQTTRRHVIPLIKGNPSKWAEPRPDLQHLTDTLTIESANGRVSNARIVYDADLDAISLAFDLNFGLMILVR